MDERIDKIKDVVWKAKRDFYLKTNIEPTHVTMHVKNFMYLKHSYYYNQRKEELILIGLIVISSYELKESDFIIGVQN